MTKCKSCGKKFEPFKSSSLLGAESQPELCPDCETEKALSQQLATLHPGSPVPTYALVAVSCLVYLIMTAVGVSWINPSVLDALRFGADFGPLTILHHQWWRLLTSTFVHFGLFHIALNMLCLLSLGSLADQIFGTRSYLLVYFVTGLAASITSLAWHPYVVSAGASGAIFGVAGALAAFIYSNRPQRASPDQRIELQQQGALGGYEEKKVLWDQLMNVRLKRIAKFLGINLLYSFRPGTDMTAHVGGLVMGLALGALLPVPLWLTTTSQQDPIAIAESESRNQRRFLILCVVCALLIFFGMLALAKYSSIEDIPLE